jgi:hypothetical protein
MERHVRVIADDPAIVTRRPGWNVKEGTGTEFVNRAVFHRSGGTAGKHQAYMLAVAMRCAYSVSNIDGPPPPRLVRGPTDCHVPDPNDFKSSFFESSYFVRLFKSFQNHFEHFWKLLTWPSLEQGNKASLA